MYNSVALVFNKRVFTDSAMTTDRTSEIIDLSFVNGYAVHWAWTGTPVGNLIIEGSNDGINFVVVDTQVAGGAASQKLFNQANINYVSLRLRYTFTSSTGILNAYVSGK